MDPDNNGITSPGNTRGHTTHGHAKLCWTRGLATVRKDRGWEEFEESRGRAVAWLEGGGCECGAANGLR